MTKYCTECGAELAEGARFCKKCGKQVMPTQPTVEQASWQRTGEYGAPGYAQTPDANQYPYQAPYSPPVSPSSLDLKPNVAATLCYPLLFFHPLLVILGVLFLALPPYNRDRFVKFHAYQSIFFGAALLLARIAVNIISFITPMALDRAMEKGLSLVTAVGLIYAMYKAYHGEAVKLPVVGEPAERQASK